MLYIILSKISQKNIANLSPLARTCSFAHAAVVKYRSHLKDQEERVAQIECNKLGKNTIVSRYCSSNSYTGAYSSGGSWRRTLFYWKRAETILSRLYSFRPSETPELYDPYEVCYNDSGAIDRMCRCGREYHSVEGLEPKQTMPLWLCWRCRQLNTCKNKK